MPEPPERWIDVTVTVCDGMAHWPGDLAYRRQMTATIAGGGGANLSQIELSAHTGTHMDAPRHFIEGGATIDSMPIEATVGRARVIEIRDPEMIRKTELEFYKPEKGERLLFKTRNSTHAWKTSEFQEKYVYIPPDTAEYLASAGVMTVGVDYLSVGGFQTGGKETHAALLGAGIWIIEGLNLEHVKPGDYQLVCLPLKLQGSDGAPARAIVRRLK
jgi:arylformamidase